MTRAEGELQPSVVELLRADAGANRHSVRLLLVVVLFRLASAARGDGRRPRLMALPVLVIYKLFAEWLQGIELPVRLKAGPGVTLFHAYGLVVHPGVRLGSRVVLKQGVTIGHRGDETVEGPVPIIGNDVVFGPGAQVLGPVRIGDGARIGAGAVVLKDVPPGATAVGVPARVIRTGGGASPAP